MPKQFKNSKKILAATVLTTALSVAPIISNADTGITVMPTVGEDGTTYYEEVNPGEPAAADTGITGMPTVGEDGTTYYEPVNPGEPAADPDQPADSYLPADLADPEVYEDEHGNKVYDYSEENLDAGIGQPAEPDEGPVVSMPTVDEFGNTVYEQGNKTSANKVSTNKVSTNKVSKVSTNQNLNPKTGDSSMIGYVGLGLSSALGLFRKRK